jgi:predicted alpha/beta hydrolase
LDKIEENYKSYIVKMHDHVEILTQDDIYLPALIFHAHRESRGVILLCPGLGIPKEFYVSYCKYLQEQNYDVLIFDYRGLGEAHLKDQTGRINLIEWAIQDIPACINYLRERHPDKKLFFFGHSIGGQIAGLVPNFHLVDKAVFFCSTGGHSASFDFPVNVFSFIMFYIQIPLVTKFFGYLPKGMTYRGVAIAKGVAQQWAKISRHPKYFLGFIGNLIPKAYYDQVNQPILWLSFTDDKIGTTRALRFMMDHYTNAEISKERIDPQKEGLPRIGHSGFFNSSKGKQLWHLPLEFIK